MYIKELHFDKRVYITIIAQNISKTTVVSKYILLLFDLKQSTVFYWEI